MVTVGLVSRTTDSVWAKKAVGPGSTTNQAAVGVVVVGSRCRRRVLAPVSWLVKVASSRAPWPVLSEMDVVWKLNDRCRSTGLIVISPPMVVKVLAPDWTKEAGMETTK